MCYSLGMTNTESTSKGTRYYIAGVGVHAATRSQWIGHATLTVTSGTIEDMIEYAARAMQESHGLVQPAVITNVIELSAGPAPAVKLDATREALIKLAGELRDTDGNPAYLAQVAEALDTIASNL